MMSRRSLGRLPITYPSIDQLNTFIVMAVTSSGEQYFLDGSAYYGGLNMLPVDLLVDKARIFATDIQEKWLDLTKISRNQMTYLISAYINKVGALEGQCSRIMVSQPAYSFKKMYNELTDSTEIYDRIKTELSVQIDSLVMEGHRDLLSNRVIQKFIFSKELDSGSDYLYINPLIFTHFTKNEFTQSERKLPVEFSYPYRFTISTNIEIPDNYIVEEIPQSEKYILNNNDGSLIYLVKQVNEKLLQVNYRFELQSIIFPHSEYEMIKTFWGQVAAKNNELIVLKKI